MCVLDDESWEKVTCYCQKPFAGESPFEFYRLFLCMNTRACLLFILCAWAAWISRVFGRILAGMYNFDEQNTQTGGAPASHTPHTHSICCPWSFEINGLRLTQNLKRSQIIMMARYLSLLLFAEMWKLRSKLKDFRPCIACFLSSTERNPLSCAPISPRSYLSKVISYWKGNISMIFVLPKSNFWLLHRLCFYDMIPV